MRFVAQAPSPDYGAPAAAELDQEDVAPPHRVDQSFEVPVASWAPITPRSAPAQQVYFVDGVQRTDAHIWTSEDGLSHMGLCVSLAAGLVRCDEEARVEQVITRRVAFGPPGLQRIECHGGVTYEAVPWLGGTPGELENKIRSEREELEITIARAAPACELLLVDGHVRQRETIPGAVGFLKSHQQAYLSPERARIVGQLANGQRTPVFLVQGSWSRLSWYVRLPGGYGHDWAGIVRCEASQSLTPAEATRLADLTAASLPRFASSSYKDVRAPQNLYPIGSLEREMRRHLGDQTWLLRSLQRAGHVSA